MRLRHTLHDAMYTEQESLAKPRGDHGMTTAGIALVLRSNVERDRVYNAWVPVRWLLKVVKRWHADVGGSRAEPERV